AFLPSHRPPAAPFPRPGPHPAPPSFPPRRSSDLGCVIVVTLAAKSLIDVMDWRIFAQFGHFVTDRPMSYSRAVRFQTSKVSHTVTSIVLGIIAVLAATGMLYDGFTWFTR